MKRKGYILDTERTCIERVSTYMFMKDYKFSDKLFPLLSWFPCFNPEIEKKRETEFNL